MEQCAHIMSQGKFDRHLRLAAGVELLKGVNDLPLLYISGSRRYVHLSQLGAKIVDMIAKRPAITDRDIADILASAYAFTRSEVQGQVTFFLRELDRVNALAAGGVDEVPAKGDDGTKIYPARLLRLRFPIWRPNRPLAVGLLARVRAHLGGNMKALFGFWMILAVALVGATALKSGTALEFSWPLLVGLLLLHMTGHESSHALVSSYYGVKVREIGVGLLYYFIPAAYVDRTDAYRLRQSRFLAHIALAGPVFDLSAAALSAAAASLAVGPTGATFHILMRLEVMICLTNLNPLLPGDGYRACEAWFGVMNLRRRAFSLLLHRVTRRRLPVHLRSLTTRQQALALVYACASIGFIALMFWQALNLGARLVIAVTAIASK